VKNETRKEQDLSQRLHEKFSKAQREFELLQQEQAKLESEQKYLNENFTMLKQSLQQTEQ
jgi:hypothetical protein